MKKISEKIVPPAVESSTSACSRPSAAPSDLSRQPCYMNENGYVYLRDGIQMERKERCIGDSAYQGVGVYQVVKAELLDMI